MSVLDTAASPPRTRGPSQRLERGALSDLVAGLAVATPLWRPHANHGPDRQPVRLVAADDWEVWVIGWNDGQRVDMYDHGLSAGAIAVVEGELTEIELHDGSRREHRLTSGSLRWLTPGTIHDVVAAGPATSLHAYSRPLASMTFYDGLGRPRWTNVIEPEAPVVDLRTTTDV